MSDGGSLSTKGLVSGSSGAPVLETSAPTVQTEPPQLETSAPTGSIIIVIPTATNTILMAAENITTNLLAQQQSNLTLPSMYKRAYLIARETDEIAIVRS
jgi:hypothetical protein